MTDYALTSNINVDRDLTDVAGNPIHLKPVAIGSTNEAGSSVFVFRPGDPLGNHLNVYTDWPSLFAAAQAVPGLKWIEVDSSLAAATVPTGTWAFSEPIHLVGWNGFTSTLTMQGAITAPTLYIDWLTVNSASSTPVFPLANLSIVVITGATIQLSGPAPSALFSTPAGANTAIEMFATTMGDGTAPVVTTAATGITNIVCTSESTINADALSGGGRAIVLLDSSSQAFGPQTVTTYSPTLVGLNEFQNVSGAIGASATISQNSTSTISRTRQGQVELSVQASFLQVGGTGAGNITMTLQRDGVNIAGAPTGEITITSNRGQVSLEYTDTLPDSAAHHYGWSATIDNGTISVGNGQASVRAKEL